MLLRPKFHKISIFFSEPRKQELVAPRPPEVPRDGVAKQPAAQGPPQPAPMAQSPLAGGPKVPLAGIIATPLPKITPPSSLNVVPLISGLNLSSPYATPNNPVSLIQVPSPTPPAGVPLQKQTQLIGLAGGSLSQQAPQPTSSSNAVSSSARPAPTSPVYDL